MSAAVSHLSLLDRVGKSVCRLSGGVVHCDLWHRRRVAALFLFYCIRGSAGHSVGSLFLSCSRVVVLPAITLLCTPSLLCNLNDAPRSTCIRLFLFVFRYGICLMSRTLLAMVWGP